MPGTAPKCGETDDGGQVSPEFAPELGESKVPANDEEPGTALSEGLQLRPVGAQGVGLQALPHGGEPCPVHVHDRLAVV